MVGSFGDDNMDGGPGNDTLFGQNNNDLLLGGDGDDLLISGQGAVRAGYEDRGDTLLGGEGMDTLIGGNANDVLDGGLDDDWMAGGEGTDVFVFTSGNDTITDFQDGADLIDISAFAGDVLHAFLQVAAVGASDSFILFFGSGDTLVIEADGGELTTLDASDFIF